MAGQIVASRIKYATLLGSWALGISTFGLFLLEQSSLFINYFGSFYQKISSILTLVVLLLACGSVLCFLLYRLCKSWETTSSMGVEEKREYLPNIFLWFQIICSILMLGLALCQIQVPLDWDEHEHISNLAGGTAWKVINPLRGSENHSLASLSTYVSLRLFGVSKIGARIPAILFSIAFLVLLNLFALQYFSKAGSVVCFLSLAGNPFVIYFMHSMRGYMPMMFFTLVLLYISLKLSNSSTIPLRRHLILFFIASGCALFSHFFGGLFLAFLLVSIIIWAYQRRGQLSKEQFRTVFSLLSILFVWLIIMGLMSYFILVHMEETGFAMTKDSIPPWLIKLATFRLFTFFGFVRIWEIRLFLLFIGLLVAWRLLYPVKKSLSLPTLLLLVGSVVVTALIKILKIPLLEGRMLLPFMVVFFFWLSETLERIPNLKWQAIASSFLLLLFILPYTIHHDNNDEVSAHFSEHDRFAKVVKQTLNSMKIPPQDRCFSFSGAPDGAPYARDFYFINEKKSELSQDCRFHYHIHYGMGLFRKEYPLSLSIPVKPLYNDGKGRVWFQIPESLPGKGNLAQIKQG